MIRQCLGFLLLLSLPAWAADPGGMVRIPGGTYRPFFKSAPVSIDPFWLDRYPVTGKEFARFLITHPEWSRARTPRIFADAHYLDNFRADSSPVTQVSWYAAKAYCEAQGKALPTQDEWEYAAQDLGRNEAQHRAETLEWYSRPSSTRPGPVGASEPNGFGVHGLYDLVWEWVDDFNTGAASDEAARFCGGASLGAADATDYAAFMRYSFRNSLEASYTTKNLGFRCAKGRTE